MSDSLWPHGLQRARLPCPSPTPGAYSNSCPSSRWCHPTISSSVVLFSSCLQSFPASGSFQMSQSFASGGQSIGASASASVLPMNIQGWFPLRFTGLISLQSKRLSRVFSNTLSTSAYHLSQHQRLFQWVDSSHQVAKIIGVSASSSVLPMNTQGWFSLGLTGLISLQSKRLSRVFSNTTIWNHQFFGGQPSIWSNCHIHGLLL